MISMLARSDIREENHQHCSHKILETRMQDTGNE